MTIGLIALRAAKEQLVAAIATIKDELKNPELADQIKFEVYDLGSDLDDHLTELGNAMPQMFADKQSKAAGERITLLDPTQGNGLVDGLTVDPATDGNPALEPGIDAPAPSNIQDAEAAGSPSAEDLDRVAEEQKAAAATDPEHKDCPGCEVCNPEHKSLGEKIKEIGKGIIDGAGEAIREAKFGD